MHKDVDAPSLTASNTCDTLQPQHIQISQWTEDSSLSEHPPYYTYEFSAGAIQPQTQDTIAIYRSESEVEEPHTIGVLNDFYNELQRVEDKFSAEIAALQARIAKFNVGSPHKL